MYGCAYVRAEKSPHTLTFFPQHQGVILAEDIGLELKAGGVSQRNEDSVMQHFRDQGIEELSFLDYLSYIPLFVFIHDNILSNPLSTHRSL